MIKFETIGMWDVAKVNPVLKSDKDIPNYSFITVDDIVYWVYNTINGDDSYREDIVIPAGEYLNGYMLKAHEGQKFLIDGKHIEGGVAAAPAGTILVPAEDGKLIPGDASGVCFVVTDDNIRLTEKAVKARVIVA